jgi:pentatricopeptide repeat protein
MEVLPQILLLMVCCWTICARMENTQKLARKIFDSMIREGIKPNVTIYGILLHGYAAKAAC